MDDARVVADGAKNVEKFLVPEILKKASRRYERRYDWRGLTANIPSFFYINYLACPYAYRAFWRKANELIYCQSLRQLWNRPDKPC